MKDVRNQISRILEDRAHVQATIAKRAGLTPDQFNAVLKLRRRLDANEFLAVCAALDRPQQTIASWEKGKSQPDANTLFELFHVLGRSVDEAFGFKAKGENNAPPLSGEALRVARDFMNLDHFGRDFVLTVLDKQLERQRKEMQEREELWAERFYPAAMEELEALKLPDGSFEVAVFDKTAALCSFRLTLCLPIQY